MKIPKSQNIQQSVEVDYIYLYIYIWKEGAEKRCKNEKRNFRNWEWRCRRWDEMRDRYDTLLLKVLKLQLHTTHRAASWNGGGASAVDINFSSLSICSSDHRLLQESIHFSKWGIRNNIFFFFWRILLFNKTRIFGSKIESG